MFANSLMVACGVAGTLGVLPVPDAASAAPIVSASAAVGAPVSAPPAHTVGQLFENAYSDTTLVVVHDGVGEVLGVKATGDNGHTQVAFAAPPQKAASAFSPVQVLDGVMSPAMPFTVAPEWTRGT